jgi:hypothetical protein
VHYVVDENEKLDYDKIRAQAIETKPKLIIAGYSSYSWIPDWKKFRLIADEVGAYLLADISHIGGLVAAGVVPSPVGIAHVVMSTTHKSLDGPRGAVLLTTDAAIAKRSTKPSFRASRADRMSMSLLRWLWHSNWRRPGSSGSCRSKPSGTRRPWRTSSRSAGCASRLAAPTATWSTSM